MLIHLFLDNKWLINIYDLVNYFYIVCVSLSLSLYINLPVSLNQYKHICLSYNIYNLEAFITPKHVGLRIATYLC